MITRGEVEHSYGTNNARLTAMDGAAKFVTINGVTQMWPVARPVTSWNPDSAYYRGTMAVPGNLARSGALRVVPSRPHVEMDPSDRNTWQREYRFSTGR